MYESCRGDVYPGFIIEARFLKGRTSLADKHITRSLYGPHVNQ